MSQKETKIFLVNTSFFQKSRVINLFFSKKYNSRPVFLKNVLKSKIKKYSHLNLLNRSFRAYKLNYKLNNSNSIILKKKLIVSGSKLFGPSSYYSKRNFIVSNFVKII